MLFIGIDLGTSAVKLLLVDENGTVLNTVSKEYPLSLPKPGWSEQDPEDWWNACMEGIPELIGGRGASQVKAIGAAGQMHGLVALDSGGSVIRPAILWNDGRTGKQVAYLNDEIGRDVVSRHTANIAFAGFTAPKLLWMRENEPELYARIDRIMLPKDYINLRLTGVFATDFSDASGTLLLDVRNKRWSAEMCGICGVEEAWLPALSESGSPVGTLLPSVASRLGLPGDVLVCAGAGDNAAAAIGAGTVGEGGCNISLGTSGTIFISSEKFSLDPNNALHSFAHADGGYHLLSCMLSAASCNKWFCGDILGAPDYGPLQASIPESRLGRNDVFFLPYLMGERSPINDINARAAFIGMGMGTARSDMVQAVLEGVAFAVRDSFEIARGLGLRIERSGLCGGGGRSALWRSILASILGIPLDLPVAEQGPGYGGAILAMVCSGAYPDVKTASRSLAAVSESVFPDAGLVCLYEERYMKFKEIYPAMKQLFAGLNK